MAIINQSPYLIMGLGGLVIIVLDLIILKSINNMKIVLDMKYYIIFPTILALTWGWASISFVGVNVNSDWYFWATFAATVTNYMQPIMNSLLYGPLIIHLFRQSFVKQIKADQEAEEIQRMKEKTIDILEKEMKHDNDISFQSDLSNTLAL
jgi:hypothetical protein